eukprot:CAMPEP_0183341382 /NCGR_PEP_ID=MMETSP0164_2-20130417/7644_1 /TAXON_ID=221442 /ORGANISM="Coccolithus pelagicus ssp braarudi, Strain PLY182g" /LENGTH=83 /DNA_ID=CAMNT_0025511683 /DNA_START=15 /DNA_END=263 /DNA_ORIENTATION=-
MSESRSLTRGDGGSWSASDDDDGDIEAESCLPSHRSCSYMLVIAGVLLIIAGVARLCAALGTNVALQRSELLSEVQARSAHWK